jgi:hypothetical protein
MAARRMAATPAPSDARQRALGGLGLVVASLQPLARAFLREAIAMSVAASVAKRDRGLMFRAIEKAFVEIEATCRPDDQEADSQAWLRRQLEGLEGGGR